MKCCLVIDDFGVISATKTLRGYSEEQKMKKLNEYILLSEGKTLSSRFLFDSTKIFDGIKIPHRIQNCLNCHNGKNGSDCVIKPNMNCLLARWSELLRRV